MTAKKPENDALLKIYNEKLKNHPDYKDDSNLVFKSIDNNGKPKAHRRLNLAAIETRMIKEIIRDVTPLDDLTKRSLLEKEFLHLYHCRQCMNRTLETLEKIQTEPATNPLRGAA